MNALLIKSHLSIYIYRLIHLMIIIKHNTYTLVVFCIRYPFIVGRFTTHIHSITTHPQRLILVCVCVCYLILKKGKLNPQSLRSNLFSQFSFSLITTCFCAKWICIMKSIQNAGSVFHTLVYSTVMLRTTFFAFTTWFRALILIMCCFCTYRA